MNIETQNCEPDLLESFLKGDLNRAQELQLTEHLESCGICRQSLESSAAEPEGWMEAGRLLKPTQFDWSADGESDFLSCSDLTNPFPLQIRNVIDSLAPSEDPGMLGQLGGYEVSGVVGAGAMGVVLKASDKSLDRTVAIKVLSPHLASSGAARKRFAREAKAAAAVLHPNVIAIHGVSNDQSMPHLVMPYVRGSSLQKRINDNGPLPVKEVLRIGAQVAAGLAAAHTQGLVHRDIKPANILLEEGVERVAITDFGLARAVDDASLTRTGIIAGTPQYMSPEQSRGESVDQRSDLFSLGSVIYAMCVGRPPFRSETTYGVIQSINDDQPTPIREINSDVPDWLVVIIDKLMSKQAADRYESAQEVSDLLEECLAHVQQPSVTPLPATLVAPARSSGFFSGSRRRTGILALMTTLGFGLLGMFLWEGTDPPDITGKWYGEGWGQVELKHQSLGHYKGVYSDTFNDEPGTMEFEWSRIERRFNGSWREGKKRFGKISLRHTDDRILGAWTTSNNSEIDPGRPHLADLQWTRKQSLVLAQPPAKDQPNARISERQSKEAADFSQQGWRLFNRGQAGEARVAFERALELDEENSAAMNGLAFSLLNQGDHQRALPMFEKLLAKMPDAGGPMNGLARSLKASGRVDEAIEIWKKMQEKSSSVNAATSGLALTFVEQGKFAEALPYLQQLVKASPKSEYFVNLLEIAKQQTKGNDKSGDFGKTINEPPAKIDVDPSKPARMILHYCDADGTPIRPLLKNVELRRALDRQGTPDVSADGKKVAFDSWSTVDSRWNTGQVIVCDIDGANAHVVCDGYMPSFSPDGKQMAISRLNKYAKADGVKGGSIWIVNTDGSMKRMIADHGAWAARWSSDGKSLVFHGGVDEKGKKVPSTCLRLYDLKTQKITNVFSPEDSPFKKQGFHFEWAKNKRTVAFSGIKKGEKKYVTATIDVDEGLDSLQLFEEPPIAHRLCYDFHPDGQSLLTTGYDNGRTVPFSLELTDDGVARVLPNVPTNIRVRDTCYTPDGNHIIAALAWFGPAVAPKDNTSYDSTKLFQCFADLDNAKRPTEKVSTGFPKAVLGSWKVTNAIRGGEVSTEIIEADLTLTINPEPSASWVIRSEDGDKNFSQQYKIKPDGKIIFELEKGRASAEKILGRYLQSENKLWIATNDDPDNKSYPPDATGDNPQEGVSYLSLKRLTQPLTPKLSDESDPPVGEKLDSISPKAVVKPLKFVEAEKMAKKLNDLGIFANQITFDARTNSLILIGDVKFIANIEKVADELDQPSVSRFPHQTMQQVNYSGVCVGDDDDRPIADAQVRFFLKSDSGYVLAKTVAANEQGRFSIRGSIPSELDLNACRMAISAPGRATTVIFYQAIGMTPPTIKLVAPASVTGRVTDSKSDPVDGATVILGQLPGVWQARTDANGKFEIADVPPAEELKWGTFNIVTAVDSKSKTHARSTIKSVPSNVKLQLNSVPGRLTQNLMNEELPVGVWVDRAQESDTKGGPEDKATSKLDIDPNKDPANGELETRSFKDRGAKKRDVSDGTQEALPVYKGHSIKWWLEKLENERANLLGEKHLLKCIGKLQDLPSSDPYILAALNKWIATAKNEIDPETLGRAAKRIVLVAGERHQSVAIAFLFRVAKIAPAIDDEVPSSMFQDNSNYLNSAIQSLPRMNESCVQELADKLENGNSRQKELALTIISAKIDQQPDSNVRQFFDAFPKLVPGLINVAVDDELIVRDLAGVVLASASEVPNVEVWGLIRSRMIELLSSPDASLNEIQVPIDVLAFKDPANKLVRTKLIELARGKDAEVVKYALRVMSTSLQNGGGNRLTELLELLDDPRWGQEIKFTTVLFNRLDRGRTIKVSQSTLTARQFAIFSLGDYRIKTPDVLRVLEKEMSSDDEETAAYAKKAMVSINANEANAEVTAKQ